MAENIVAVSLFSGAGGLDVASIEAGIPVVSSTDIEHDCIETLKLNRKFDKTEIIEGDLHQIESSVFREILDRHPHDKFIVIGEAHANLFQKLDTG